MSATRREDNNRIQEKDDHEMEATVFDSRETTSGLFTLGELETEENSDKVASWEIPTAQSLFTKIALEVLMIELKLLPGCDTSMKTTTRICAAIAGSTAIHGRKYSERSIT